MAITLFPTLQTAAHRAAILAQPYGAKNYLYSQKRGQWIPVFYCCRQANSHLCVVMTMSADPLTCRFDNLATPEERAEIEAEAERRQAERRAQAEEAEQRILQERARVAALSEAEQAKIRAERHARCMRNRELDW